MIGVKEYWLVSLGDVFVARTRKGVVAGVHGKFLNSFEKSRQIIHTLAAECLRAARFLAAHKVRLCSSRVLAMYYPESNIRPVHDFLFAVLSGIHLVVLFQRMGKRTANKIQPGLENSPCSTLQTWKYVLSLYFFLSVYGLHTTA